MSTQLSESHFTNYLEHTVPYSITGMRYTIQLYKCFCYVADLEFGYSPWMCACISTIGTNMLNSLMRLGEGVCFKEPPDRIFNVSTMTCALATFWPEFALMAVLVSPAPDPPVLNWPKVSSILWETLEHQAYGDLVHVGKSSVVKGLYSQRKPLTLWHREQVVPMGAREHYSATSQYRLDQIDHFPVPIHRMSTTFTRKGSCPVALSTEHEAPNLWWGNIPKRLWRRLFRTLPIFLRISSRGTVHWAWTTVSAPCSLLNM